MTRRGDPDKPKGRQRPIGVIRDIEPYRAVASDIACGGKRPVISGRRQHREFLQRNGYIEVGNESKPTRSDALTPEEARLDLIDDIRRAMGDFGSNTGARPAPIAQPPAVDDDAIKILIQNERTRRKALHTFAHEADQGSERVNDPSSRKLLREWWAAVGALLDGLSKEMKPQSAPSTPHDLFFILGDLATCLGGGHIHEMIMDVGSQGRHPIGPAEKRDIQVAVTYRYAVEKNKIHDPHPTKSIVKAFGLRTSGAAEGWYKNRKKYPLRLKLLEFPDSLRERMERAGRRYRQANRHTQEGILANAMKPQARPARK